MLLLKTVIFLIIFTRIICDKNEIVEFLAAFFEDKNVTITANICWTFDEIKKLTQKLFSLKIPKFLNINTNLNNLNFPANLHNNFFILDVNCKNVTNILKKANELRLFRRPYKWLLIQSQQENIPLYNASKKILSELDIFVDSEVIWAEKIEKKIAVSHFYTLNKNSTIIQEKYGEWQYDTGFQIQLTYNVTSVRRRNLRGTNIKIVIVIFNNDTLNHLEDFRYPATDLVAKVPFGMVMALIYYLNGTGIKIASHDYGVRSKNGTWSGMCGLIQQEKADIAGSPLIMFKIRLEYAHFVALLNPTALSFIFRKPPLSYERNIFLMPFESTVWISSICTVLIIAVLLLVSSYFENPNNEEIQKIRFGNIILLIFGAICQQGCDIAPKGIPGRMLTLSIFTAFMFLYVSYAANIVALLQSTSPNIKTIEDLLKSRMKVGSEDMLYSRQYFPNSSRAVVRALYKEKIGPQGFYNLSYGIEKLRQGLFALHVEEGAAYHSILKTFHEHEKCELSSIQGIFEEEYGWITIPKYSKYTELFKIGFAKIIQFGIKQRFLKIFNVRSQCIYKTSSFTNVGIIDFYPALLIFLYGIMVAVVILICEKIHYKYSINSNKNNYTYLNFNKKN